MAVEVGDSVSLLCRVEGSPLPQVAWSRQDGKPVTGWHGPPGVSRQLEAAELLIDSKSAERVLAWRRARTGIPPGSMLTVSPLGALPLPRCRLVSQQWGYPLCPLFLR